MVLSADMDVTNLCLTEDLFIDLNGYDLSGVINTNGYKVYGMDSTTNAYSWENMGYFSCVDEDGNAIIPESLYTTEDSMRYMAIETETGYTFHRFYLGITHVSLAPTVTGFGYKAAFYGDEMVQNRIASIGYDLWLTEDHVVSRSLEGFKNSLTLRLKNLDVANYGEAPINANVVITLWDGTMIESAVHSDSLRQTMEKISAAYLLTPDVYSQEQIQALQQMILDNDEAMKYWDLSGFSGASQQWAPYYASYQKESDSELTLIGVDLSGSIWRLEYTSEPTWDVGDAETLVYEGVTYYKRAGAGDGISYTTQEDTLTLHFEWGTETIVFQRLADGKLQVLSSEVDFYFSAGDIVEPAYEKVW